MKIDLCVHCYSEDLAQYAAFLKAQLHSLSKSRLLPNRIWVFHTETDLRTKDVLNLAFQGTPIQDRLRGIAFSRGQLFRRSIGRNLAALATTADLIWFTDCDHTFQPVCLEYLAKIWKSFKTDPKPVMVFPEDIQIQISHEKGDEFWKNGSTDINPLDFLTKKYSRAIGGVQIVNGDFARKYGYLADNKKMQTPTDGLKPFPSFSDDVKFRKFCESQGKIEKIQLPGLFRLRHTETTYQD